MKIQYTLTPTPADVQFLTHHINQETPGCGATTFGFFIRNDKDEIIAGCNGLIIFGSIYTDQIWVNPAYRRQGLGRQLMERVHAHGQQHGVRHAAVHIMSFQDLGEFYEKLGYTSDYARAGYVNDSSCIFLKKDL